VETFFEFHIARLISIRPYAPYIVFFLFSLYHYFSKVMSSMKSSIVVAVNLNFIFMNSKVDMHFEKYILPKIAELIMHIWRYNNLN
jgi:hypothetical protein